MPKRAAQWIVRLMVFGWRLPRWVKALLTLAVILAVAGAVSVDVYRQWRYHQDIYSVYYNYFYASYSQTLPRNQADYYADYYAEFYADYYSSRAYRKSSRFALPSATEETISYPETSAVARLSITKEGLDIIKRYEGLKLEPYTDATGNLTIGYGHLIKPGEYFTVITKQEAHELLLKDVRVAEAYVKRYVKVPLTAQQFSALTSFVYNLGPSRFRGSTLLREVNDGNMRSAANEFLRWTKAGTQTLHGLARRRAAEKALFES